MKKILAPLAALSLLASLSVSAESFYSNTVGMIKHDLSDSEFKMVALQLDEGQSSIALEEAFGSLNDLTTIFVYDPSATANPYSTYVYYDGFGWYEGVSPVVEGEVMLNRGSSVWIKDGGGGSSPIHSGRVPEESSIDVTLVAGLNMISNPYPVPLRIIDLDTSNLSDRDVIWVYDNVYTKYTYFEGFGWYEGVSPIDENAVIDAGLGFWIFVQNVDPVTNVATLSFTKPY